MALTENIGIILAVIVGIAIIVVIFLMFVEKRLFKKILKIKFTKNEMYIEKISKLNTSTPRKTLLGIDKIARAFFNEAFRTKTSVEYSELKDLFEKRKNKKIVEFSGSMSSFLYSGKKPTKEENQKLTTLLAEIIDSNKIISKEEKEKLDKKSLEKDKSKNKLSKKKKRFFHKIKGIFKKGKRK